MPPSDTSPIDGLYVQVDQPKRREYVPPHNKLGVLPLSLIILFSVSGGPFGIEACIRNAGFLFGVSGVVIVSIIWSMPECLMTAELGSAFPEASGGVAWVEEAFGSAWGWMAGKNLLVAGATDNAIYPVLILDYALQLGPVHLGKGIRFILLSCISIILGYVNWLGLHLVGKIMIVIALLALGPFVVMIIVGSFQIDDTSRWLMTPSSEYAAAAASQTNNGNNDANMDGDDSTSSYYNGLFPNMELGNIIWRPFLNALFWNLNSFNHAAHFAGDVHDVGMTYPRAIFIAWTIVVTIYFLTLIVAIGATDSVQEDWREGYLSKAAKEIGGPFLGGWVAFAAAVTNIAMFQTELSKNSLLLAGMAERNYLPEFFQTRSTHNTPTYAILTLICVSIIGGIATFDKLVEILNFQYAIALLMQFAAFIRLRISYPNLGRPFAIPFGTIGSILITVPAMIFLIVILLLAQYSTMIFALVLNIFAFFLYHFSGRIPQKYTPLRISNNGNNVGVGSSGTGKSSHGSNSTTTYFGQEQSESNIAVAQID